MNITARTERPIGTANPFFRKLGRVAPRLANYLRDPGRQAKIALFYGPRDSVQHRLVLTGAHLNTGQPQSDCNVVFLNQDDTNTMQVVDHASPRNEPFSTWGKVDQP